MCKAHRLGGCGLRSTRVAPFGAKMPDHPKSVAFLDVGLRRRPGLRDERLFNLGFGMFRFFSVGGSPLPGSSEARGIIGGEVQGLLHAAEAASFAELPEHLFDGGSPAVRPGLKRPLGEL